MDGKSELSLNSATLAPLHLWRGVPEGRGEESRRRSEEKECYEYQA